MEKTIAYFDSSHDAPEEIIMAAGFSPLKILGDVRKPTAPADQYLSNIFCPAARSFLTEALENSKNWAGILVAHGCDATNRHFDIWRMHVTTPFLQWVNTPMKTDKSAAKFYKIELNRVINAIEKQFNVQITPEKLKAAIKTSNEIKAKLREIGALRATKDISNKEFFETVKIGLNSPKAEVLSKLSKTLQDFQSRGAFPDNKKKIFLTGSDVTYSEWFELMDKAGLRVVRDDLSIGERYFATSIPDKADPVEALVEYNFNIPRPATRHPPDPRLDYIMKIVGESKLNGVVSQNMKFCEVYAYDAVFTVNAFKTKGIPAIHLEREFTAAVDQQMITRLEAFRETLN